MWNQPCLSLLRGPLKPVIRNFTPGVKSICLRPKTLYLSVHFDGVLVSSRGVSFGSAAENRTTLSGAFLPFLNIF